MGFGRDQLRSKALLALEEAIQQLRYRRVEKTIALRFALAYLWTISSKGREPYDEIWRAFDMTEDWRMAVADRALASIYETLGVARDEEVSWRMWRLAQAKYAPSADEPRQN